MKKKNVRVARRLLNARWVMLAIANVLGYILLQRRKNILKTVILIVFAATVYRS
jgi:hypothetical protein